MSQNTLSVHMQVLLAVVLAVFCWLLVLGCVLCWRRRRRASLSAQDKESGRASPRPVIRSPSPRTRPVKQQYEELEGDVLELPSLKPASPSPSASPPPRRLSSPAVPCAPRAAPPPPHRQGRASLPSLPSLPRLRLGSRPRRRTLGADSFLACGEGSAMSLVASSCPQYGSAAPVPAAAAAAKPSALQLHFSVAFSPARGTLAVSVAGLTGASAAARRRLRRGVSVRVSLPPLHPAPLQAPARRRSPAPGPQSFLLPVRAAEELRRCTLRLAVQSRGFSGLREAALGLVEMACGEMDWEPDAVRSYVRELSPTNGKLEESQSSQGSLGRRRSSAGPCRALGQVFILLQHQALAQRVKVMVRKAEGLAKLSRMPGTPDHFVVINLRQAGEVIASKETKGAAGPSPVWNAPFLFDLPPGDIAELPLVFEFVVMQGRLYTKSSVLGTVLIGRSAPEAGQGHWTEMCRRGQLETARWHTLQSDGP